MGTTDIRIHMYENRCKLYVVKVRDILYICFIEVCGFVSYLEYLVINYNCKNSQLLAKDNTLRQKNSRLDSFFFSIEETKTFAVYKSSGTIIAVAFGLPLGKLYLIVEFISPPSFVTILMCN